MTDAELIAALREVSGWYNDRAADLLREAADRLEQLAKVEEAAGAVTDTPGDFVMVPEAWLSGLRDALAASRKRE